MVDKTDELHVLVNKFNVAVVGISEHWLDRNSLSIAGLTGFKLASAYCRLSGDRGGTAIFLRDWLKYDELDYLVDLSISSVCEVAAVFIQEWNVICLEVYRVPDRKNFDMFIECLCNVFNVLCIRNKTKASVLLCGDFNVDLLVNDSHKSVFINLLESFILRCTVCDVTRPSTRAGGLGTCILYR